MPLIRSYAASDAWPGSGEAVRVQEGTMQTASSFRGRKQEPFGLTLCRRVLCPHSVGLCSGLNVGPISTFRPWEGPRSNPEFHLHPGYWKRRYRCHLPFLPTSSRRGLRPHQGLPLALGVTVSTTFFSPTSPPVCPPCQRQVLVPLFFPGSQPGPDL